MAFLTILAWGYFYLTVIPAFAIVGLWLVDLGRAWIIKARQTDVPTASFLR